MHFVRDLLDHLHHGTIGKRGEGEVGLIAVMIKRRLQTLQIMQTVQAAQTPQTPQTPQTVQFFVFLFLNRDFTCDYSFGNVGTVQNFWTPHDEILRGYLEQPNLLFNRNA